jgi:hypothetical protein
MQGPSWETNGPCGNIENTCSLWPLWVHYCVQTHSSWLCILTQTNPVKTLQNDIFKNPSAQMSPNWSHSFNFLSISLYAFFTPTFVLYNLPISLSLNWSLSYITYQTVIILWRVSPMRDGWHSETPRNVTATIAERCASCLPSLPLASGRSVLRSSYVGGDVTRLHFVRLQRLWERPGAVQRQYEY